MKLASDEVLTFVVGSRNVEVRCRMPQGGDQAIWSIQVDGTWYGMNRECQPEDTVESIRQAATEWLQHDFPEIVRE
jgi:hypothetical protein